MNTPCRIWEGYIHKDTGYGYILKRKHGERPTLAHRWAYCQANNVTLEQIKGKVVRHTCDIPSCVEPTHLILGTQVDNMRDMTERGRGNGPKGERAARAVLTEDNVREIILRVSRGENQGVLAEQFNINRRTVSKIANRKRWAHVILEEQK